MIESIMDFVFNNLFIVIIAIAIKSNLVSSSKKTQRQSEQNKSPGNQNENSQTNKRESLESKIERNLKKFENAYEDNKQEEVKENNQESQPLGRFQTSSIDEQRKEQEEAIAKRFQSNTQVTDETDEGRKDYADSPAIVRHHRKKSLVNHNSIKTMMTNKALQEIEDMDEILGKPRSLKTYKPGRSD